MDTIQLDSLSIKGGLENSHFRILWNKLKILLSLSFIFVASEHNVSFSFRLNDNHKALSYGGVTSGSLADTSGNCVNNFGDSCVSVIELSLLSGLYYPLTLWDMFSILSFSSHWNHWTTHNPDLSAFSCISICYCMLVLLLLFILSPQESVIILCKNFKRKVLSTVNVFLMLDKTKDFRQHLVLLKKIHYMGNVHLLNTYT